MAYSKDTQQIYPWKKEWKTTNIGYAVPAYSGSANQPLILPGTKSGESVPQWRGKVRKGLNAGSPYNLYAQKVDKKTVEFNRTFEIMYDSWSPDGRGGWYWEPWRTHKVIGNQCKPFSASYGHLVLSTSKAEATALKKTYQKVLQEQQHLNSLAVLAEFGDVIRQFGAPFSSIVKLTHKYLEALKMRRKGLKGGPRLRDEKWHEIMASSYLEYVFGLEPLIGDTERVAEAFARWNFEKTGEAKFRKAISGRGLETISTSVPNGDSYDGLTAFTGVTKVTTENRVQYKCGMSQTFQAPFGSNERLLQLLGVSPRNLLPALWEAVPWSWLMDYATNVGDIITAAATSTVDVKWIIKSVTRRTTRTTTLNFDAAMTNDNLRLLAPLPSVARIKSITGSQQVGYSNHVITSLTRTIPDTLGIPPLVFGFDPSLKQWGNLLAVMIQMRKSWGTFSVPSKL